MRLLGNICWFIFGGFISGMAWVLSGALSFLVNVIWFLVNGWWMALGNFLIGCVWCITIVGIPFGKQFFKIAKLALRPFGAYIVRV